MHNLRGIQHSLVLNEGLLAWGVKSKCVLSLHEGNVVETVTKTKLLEGITVFAANITAGLVISSAVCTDKSCLSLNCNIPSGPQVIPN